MTIMTEQDMADYMKVRSAREVWIEACHSGAEAMAGHDNPGPAIAARDEAASAVIEAAILAMAEENKRLREALEKIERAGTFQPHREDPPAFDAYADIARRALGKDKA